MTTYEIPGAENAETDTASHHAYRHSSQLSSAPVQQLPRQNSESSSHVTSPTGDTADGTNSGMIQTLLGCNPSMGFMNFLDNWLESQGLKSPGMSPHLSRLLYIGTSSHRTLHAPDGPSPVLEAWRTLHATQRSDHECRANYELDMRSPNGSSQPQATRAFAGSAGRNRQFSRGAAPGRSFNAAEKELTETEKTTVDGFIKNIVQQVSSRPDSFRALSDAMDTAGHPVSGLGDELPPLDCSSISAGRFISGPLPFSARRRVLARPERWPRN